MPQRSASHSPARSSGAAQEAGAVPPRPAYRVYIETFGCQMNEYDTELIRALLKTEGFGFTEERTHADVVLMNTCAIRENAHNKVYGHLADLKAAKRQRRLVVGVLGCMAQNLKQELVESGSVVDVLVGPDGYRRLPDLLFQAIEARDHGAPRARIAVDLSEYETYEDILPERAEGVNAWIAIMRGCDNFCSFCVVPYTRGRERSRDPHGIILEVERLVSQGHRQVTLLGQNVNSYRFDTREGTGVISKELVLANSSHEKKARLGASGDREGEVTGETPPGAGGGHWDFARLITAVAEVPGIERVRFTSPHPKDFPPALLDAVAGHPKICKHIHLPLQSGNDRILDMMNRTYSRKEYVALVEQIRRRRPEITLTTDIICGFPSETQDEFMDTSRLVEEVGFHAAFIFKYSERKHTIAARKYPDDVPEPVKSERVGHLVERQRKISLHKNLEVIGNVFEVLVEAEAKKSSAQWMGRTDGNLTVVWPKDDSEIRPGDLIPVKINAASAATLLGTAVRAQSSSRLSPLIS